LQLPDQRPAGWRQAFSLEHGESALYYRRLDT
jgi:hypothetical protein